MAKAEASVEELVGMIERGELRLPEMQRRYVWRSTRVRDLLDSLYRGYPSGAILLWQTDEDVPLQDMAVGQKINPYTAREADDIANLSFIGGKTNRRISDKAPIDYLPSMIEKSGEAAFASQCIPTDEKYLTVESYKTFLKERRSLVARHLNEFLGS